MYYVKVPEVHESPETVDLWRPIMASMDQHIWQDMFRLGVPVAEKILRPILVYIFLIVGLRLAGKRELAQLNPFDLVVLLTLSNTVQNAIIGEDNSVIGGVIGASTLLFVNYVLVRFLSRHETLERLVEGEPRVLMEMDTSRRTVCGRKRSASARSRRRRTNRGSPRSKTSTAPCSTRAVSSRSSARNPILTWRGTTRS